jgi:SLOG in TRPM, prokaryote
VHPQESTGDQAWSLRRRAVAQTVKEQTGDIQAPRVGIVSTDDIAAALDGAGLRRDRVVIVLVGGAGGMAADDLETVTSVLRNEVVPIAERRDAVVIDGGTDSGVMRLIGRARSASGGRFPLVGVAAEGTIADPWAVGASPDAVELEPNHTLFLLVPGTRWGDEARWITEVAKVVAGGRPSVTVLVNGGQIAYTDAAGSLGSGRPVVVLAGSGRTADAIAEARAGNGGDNRAVEIAASPLTRVVDVGEAGAVTAEIEAALDLDRAETAG